MWGEHQGMGWWMLLGSIWFVVFWGILIWFVFQLVDRRRLIVTPRTKHLKFCGSGMPEARSPGSNSTKCRSTCAAE